MNWEVDEKFEKIKKFRKQSDLTTFYLKKCSEKFFISNTSLTGINKKNWSGHS